MYQQAGRFNILLIGDEPGLLRMLRRNLLERGYDVNLALDGSEAGQLILRYNFDLFVLNLDFTSIDVDGLEICTSIREKSKVPLIGLSAIGEESRKIKALDYGADDYLVMPFSMEEFLARVRSSIRRWSNYNNAQNNKTDDLNEDVILFNGLRIDLLARKVFHNNNIVRLTPTEYDILVYLAQKQGQVVTHREILRSIWGTEYGDEREYLRVFISQIRKKLGDNSLETKYVITEPGVGYRFEG